MEVNGLSIAMYWGFFHSHIKIDLPTITANDLLTIYDIMVIIIPDSNPWHFMLTKQDGNDRES